MKLLISETEIQFELRFGRVGRSADS